MAVRLLTYVSTICTNAKRRVPRHFVGDIYIYSNMSLWTWAVCDKFPVSHRKRLIGNYVQLIKRLAVCM